MSASLFLSSSTAVLDCFDPHTPLTIRQVYRKLSEGNDLITFGAQNSVADYINACNTFGYIEKHGDGYVLTNRGCDRLKTLKRAVRVAKARNNSNGYYAAPCAT